MHRYSSTIKIYQFGYLSLALSLTHTNFQKYFCLHFAAIGDINGSDPDKNMF